MKFRAITTCNYKGWLETGRAMAESFVRHWEGVDLTVYAEGFTPEVEGIRVADLPAWVGEFKAKYGHVPDAKGMASGVYDYRRDCIRFAHKVGAITAAARTSEGILIWLDADTLTHDDVNVGWLERLFRQPAYIAWLNREKQYPECGFLMFDTEHRAHAEVMRRLENVYRSGDVFVLPETHDSYVIEKTIEKARKDGLIERPCSLSRPGYERGHVFINSVLADKLDHAKGKRKAAGRTPPGERKIRDGHPYWK